MRLRYSAVSSSCDITPLNYMSPSLQVPMTCPSLPQLSPQSDNCLLLNWCRWPESNRHSFRHRPLKTACLPIPPHRLIHVATVAASNTQRNSSYCFGSDGEPGAEVSFAVGTAGTSLCSPDTGVTGITISVTLFLTVPFCVK